MKKSFRTFCKLATFVCFSLLALLTSCAQNLEAISEEQIQKSDEELTKESEVQESATEESDAKESESEENTADSNDEQNQKQQEQTESVEVFCDIEEVSQKNETLLHTITFEAEEGFTKSRSYKKESTLTGKTCTIELTGGNVSATGKIQGEQSLLLRVYEEETPISAKVIPTLESSHKDICKIDFDAKLDFPSKTSAKAKKTTNLTLTVSCKTESGALLAEKNIDLSQSVQSYCLEFPKVNTVILNFTAKSNTNTASDAILDNIHLYAN